MDSTGLVAKTLTPRPDRAPPYAVRIAGDVAAIEAAQALRHRVFVEEGGAGGGPLSGGGLERDRFDEACLHLLVVDAAGEAVGTTRLLDAAGAARAGGFATEEEFDIGPLRRDGRALLEVGRTCLLPRHRGGLALQALWQGVGAVAAEGGAGIVFGLASLPGTDAARAGPSLAFLRERHLAPEALRPRSRAPVAEGPPPQGAEARRAAVLGLPPLVKGYLRMGATVGEGGFCDPAFGCIDLCMVLEVTRLADRARALYAGGA